MNPNNQDPQQQRQELRELDHELMRKQQELSELMAELARKHTEFMEVDMGLEMLKVK